MYFYQLLVRLHVYAFAMRTCFCNISALELYRTSGRLVPDILERPRTSKIADCSVPAPEMLADDLVRYGISSTPCHVLCGTKTRSRNKNAVRHTHRLPLPSRSLITLSKDILVVCPELLFLELAATSAINDYELLGIGFELCGTYVLDVSEHTWDGFTNTSVPLTTTKRIASYLDRYDGITGMKRARKLFPLIADGSHSPMETVTALLVSLPTSMGGWGFGPIKMNQHVETADGSKWIDIFFPDAKVGLEYKGRRAHSVERSARDDRRQNRLTSTGITIFNIWYEDLAQKHLCDQLRHDVGKALGKRVRQRSDTFEARRQLLHASLLPSLRYREH